MGATELLLRRRDRSGTEPSSVSDAMLVSAAFCSTCFSPASG
jgi:hypothetical protein